MVNLSLKQWRAQFYASPLFRIKYVKLLFYRNQGRQRAIATYDLISRT